MAVTSTMRVINRIGTPGPKQKQITFPVYSAFVQAGVRGR